jgi:hypothetical protein
MKKFALMAVATAVALTGAVSTASAALTDRDATIWHQKDVVLVAGRGGDKGGRNDGGRNDGGRSAHRDKKSDKVIWRIRDGKHRPLWFFRPERGEDCFTRKMRVQNADGTVSTRSVHMCE